MPEQKAIIAQLKTPTDENGERKDLFPRTAAQAIEYFDKEGNQTTLQEFLKQKVENGESITSDDVPFVSETEPNHACLWAKVKSVDDGEETL